MGRKPKEREEFAQKKIRPRTENPKSSYDEPPAFSFKYIRKSHCLDCCTLEEKKDLAEALHKRKDTSWNDLLFAPKNGLGYEKINGGWKVSLPEEHKEKQMLAFRFSGNKPIVGFKEREIFYILWIDRAFNVYKHSKKRG